MMSFLLFVATRPATLRCTASSGLPLECRRRDNRRVELPDNYRRSVYLQSFLKGKSNKSELNLYEFDVSYRR